VDEESGESTEEDDVISARMCQSLRDKEKLEWGWRREASSWLQRQGTIN